MTVSAPPPCPLLATSEGTWLKLLQEKPLEQVAQALQAPCFLYS